jgi:hypothetical protein
MPWYTRFARHYWIDAKLGSEDRWRRFEVESERSGARCEPITARTARSDWRWSHESVRLCAAIEGERARCIAERLEELTTRLAPGYANGYRAWPGPNSNTIVRELADELPELRFAFEHNAVGKDHASWFDAGWTTSGTGVRADTLPLGAALGLREGVELHLLQLTFGISLWPPRLELPFLPELPWSDEPRETEAYLEMPREVQASITAGAFTSSRVVGRMSVPCIEPLAPDGLLLVRSNDGEAWISCTARLEPPSAGEPEGALVVRVVERDAQRRVHDERRSLDGSRNAALGP